MDENAELIVLQMLIEQGALEVISIDKNGDPVYRVTPKCREIFPELFYSHLSDVNNIAFDLWDLGVIEIEFDESSHKVFFKKSNYERYLELKDTLTDDQHNFINAIIDRKILDSLENPNP